VQLKKKLSDIKLKLEWVERLDLVNDQAPLAPELALKVSHSNYNYNNTNKCHSVTFISIVPYLVDIVR